MVERLCAPKPAYLGDDPLAIVEAPLFHEPRSNLNQSLEVLSRDAAIARQQSEDVHERIDLASLDCISKQVSNPRRHAYQAVRWGIGNAVPGRVRTFLGFHWMRDGNFACL